MNGFFRVMVSGLLLVAVGSLSAQEKKRDVSFLTLDGMELKGTFYPSPRGGSPVVLFIHKIGGKRTDGEWDALATTLQDKGYAVLSFDLRGHGSSTRIAKPELFWSARFNQVHLARYDPKKKTLGLTDFRTSYLPYLVNDIVAARQFLDNENDSGAINTSNIVVIGAEDGAALGFFWIVSEFRRGPLYLPSRGNLFDLQILPSGPETAGDDIAGAIWLSYKRHLGSRSTISVPYQTWISNKLLDPVRDQVQMWFAAGAKDAQGIEDANYMYDTVLRADKKKDRLPLTSKIPIEGTSLRGIALTGQKGLPTVERIEQFLSKAFEMRRERVSKRRDAANPPLFVDPTRYFFR
ncbi:MAG: alpha/beta hydrolase [Gemmataceae bacterium]|nr:alpha/beta hydrolase [Gemmataceae bacterium]